MLRAPKFRFEKSFKVVNLRDLDEGLDMSISLCKQEYVPPFNVCILYTGEML